MTRLERSQISNEIYNLRTEDVWYIMDRLCILNDIGNTYDLWCEFSNENYLANWLTPNEALIHDFHAWIMEDVND